MTEAPNEFNLTHLDATSLGDLYRDGRASPVDVVNAHFDRISALEPTVGAFVTLRHEAALAEARESSARWLKHEALSPLDGVPVAIKDMMAVAGLPMTGGSANPWPPSVSDAEAVRLLRAAGAIVVGTNTLHEYAFGGTSVNAHVGTPRNPRDLTRIAGGSSGGSAAAVASGFVVGALGTETGNSVRRPAAFCGVVGFKPTYGRVSRRGVIPLAPSLDHVGVLTRSVRDASMVTHAISGYDPLEAGSRRPFGDASHSVRGVDHVVIGVPRDLLIGTDPEISAAFEGALIRLAEQGARVRDVSLPLASRWTAITSSIIMHTEAAVVHAERFRADPGSYGEDVASRIISGQAFTSAEITRAHWLREQIGAELAYAFGEPSHIDVVLAPAVPAFAPPLAPGAFVPGDAPWSTDLGPFHLQRLPSLLGLPAGSVPTGWTVKGLPLPVMAMGALWNDSLVLAVLEAVCANVPVATPGSRATPI